VLSPYTALLVLETDDDYARFKVDRRALVDVLSVEQGRLALLHRTAPPPSKNAPSRKPAARVRAPMERDESTQEERENAWGRDIGDAFGAGGLGLSGVGEGGGGRGEGIGLGSLGGDLHGAHASGAALGGGNGHGRLGGSHQTRTPSLRMGAASVSGRLPP